MSSKKSKKKKEKLQPSQLPEEPKRDSQLSGAEDDPFDFGGLPKRDLKKNLGCG